MINFLNQFRDAIQAAGLEPPGAIEPGKLHRFPGVDKRKGNTAGWCKLFDDGLGGCFGDWSSGYTENWQAKRDKAFSQSERSEFMRRVSEARKHAESVRHKQHADAAAKAQAIWDAATPANHNHRYLVNKGIKANGARLYQGALVIAVRASCKIHSLQFIAEDGSKRFLSGGHISGGYFSIGYTKGAKALCIAEGYATGVTVHQATEYPVAVAFYAGNLEPVAKAMRERFPDLPLIICADDDAEIEGNPGVTKANIAADAVGAKVAVPVFGKQRPDGVTDFNDLATLLSLEAVTNSINMAAQPNCKKGENDKEAQVRSLDPQSVDLFEDDGKRKSQSTLLIDIGKTANLFHDATGDAYAEITSNGIKAAMPVRSKEFREYIAYGLYDLTGRGANATAATDAINTLEAEAKYSGVEKTVAIRAHNTDGGVFIDLGCDRRRVIQINKNGWWYSQKAPVKFIRKRGMVSLPNPSDFGDIQLLEKYLNVKSKELPLIYAWIFCALAGVKPYPVLVLQGEQGTGKSIASRVIRALVDPSSVPLRSPPRDLRDLLVSAQNNHVVVLDNLSGLSGEMSDCLCRFSTGGGVDSRTLYTNSEQNLIDIQRPVLVNGIDDIAARPDLAERSLIINLPPIESDKRRSEKEFWREFEAEKPIIFTGFLTSIASGLKHINDVILDDLPRMADAAYWVTACERDLGIEGAFLHSHTKNQLESIELGIESSPTGSAIMTLMSKQNKWVGTPTDLMSALSNIADDNQLRSRAWPQTTKGLKNAITRLAPNFRKLGLDITRRKGGTGRSYIIEKVSFYPSQASHSSQKTLDPSNRKGSSGDTYKSYPSPMCPSMTHSVSIRHTTNPAMTSDVTLMTDRTDQNQEFLNSEVY